VQEGRVSLHKDIYRLSADILGKKIIELGGIEKEEG